MHLDLTTDLPKIRKAFDAGEIVLGQCTYASPCAIGALMPPELRVKSDIADPTALGTSPNIRTLVRVGLVTMPEDQLADWALLQCEVDAGNRQEVDTLLRDLEGNYNVA